MYPLTKMKNKSLDQARPSWIASMNITIGSFGVGIRCFSDAVALLKTAMATIRATEDKLIATTAYESKLDIVDSEVAKVRGMHFSDIGGHYSADRVQPLKGNHPLPSPLDRCGLAGVRKKMHYD